MLLLPNGFAGLLPAALNSRVKSAIKSDPESVIIGSPGSARTRAQPCVGGSDGNEGAESWRSSPGLALVAASRSRPRPARSRPTRASRPRRSRSAARSRSPGRPSLYKTIPTAERAYFAYVNDHGGVNGRKIDFNVYDDAYDPSKTVPLTQQLVEQDKVFAVFGSLGTAPSLATLGLPEQQEGAAGARRDRRLVLGLLSTRSTRGRSAGSRTIPGEAKIYGQYINREHPEREDRRALPERRLRQELLRGPPRRPRREEVATSSTRSRTTSTATSVTQQILALKAAGRRTSSSSSRLPTPDDQRARDRDEGRLDAPTRRSSTTSRRTAIFMARRGERRGPSTACSRRPTSRASTTEANRARRDAELAKAIIQQVRAVAPST